MFRLETWKLLLSLGSDNEREAPPLVVHSRSITPSRISARPSVATALTTGSRLASAVPNTSPYRVVISAENATQISHATPCGRPQELMACHAIRAPMAPTAPNDRFSTPV